MSDILPLLLGPGPKRLPPGAIRRLERPAEWQALSSVIDRCRLGALVGPRLRRSGAALPSDVQAWLDSERRQTARRNLFLTGILHETVALLATGGVPALALKGPVLAHLGVGLLARPFHDVDLLIPADTLSCAEGILTSAGFAPVPAARHHRALVRRERTEAAPTILEIHVDLSDEERGYRPALEGIWARATVLALRGRKVRVPAITDQLLLTIIQLPHHRWHPRLLADVAGLLARWGAVVDWALFTRNADAWGARALAGASLAAVRSVLAVPLPEAAGPLTRAEGYLRRVQWQVVRAAVLEQLGLARTNVAELAALLLVDRPGDLTAVLRGRIGNPRGGRPGGTLPPPVRRLAAGASMLPSMLGVLRRAAPAPSAGGPPADGRGRR